MYGYFSGCRLSLANAECLESWGSFLHAHPQQALCPVKTVLDSLALNGSRTRVPTDKAWHLGASELQARFYQEILVPKDSASLVCVWNLKIWLSDVGKMKMIWAHLRKHHVVALPDPTVLHRNCLGWLRPSEGLASAECFLSYLFAAGSYPSFWFSATVTLPWKRFSLPLRRFRF